MNKKIIYLLILILLLSLTSCWNYRSLADMEIVSSMAIDKEDDKYLLTMEIFNISGNIKEEGIQQNIVESEGETIFDAIRNSKIKTLRLAYFGNMETIFISEDIVSEDLVSLIDFFLRDAEIRETLRIIIPQATKAKDILSVTPIDFPIIGLQLNDIVEDDKNSTASTIDNSLYELYSILKADGYDMVISAAKITTNNEESIAEINGVAVFKQDQLVGYLDPIETKYFLYAIDKIEGGLLTFDFPNNKDQKFTLEVIENNTKKSFSYVDQQIKITLEPKVKANLAEVQLHTGGLDPLDIQQLEKIAEEALIKRMLAVINKVQSAYGADIFGFGNFIYKKDPDLWNDIKGNWYQIFPSIEIEIIPQFNISETGYINNT